MRQQPRAPLRDHDRIAAQRDIHPEHNMQAIRARNMATAHTCPCSCMCFCNVPDQLPDKGCIEPCAALIAAEKTQEASE